MAETENQSVAAELRAGAARVRETFTPAATARVLHRTHVAVCGNHAKSPTLVCHGCAYFDTEDPVLARLLVALLNTREPLAAWLEQAAVWWDQTTVVLTDPNHVEHDACGGVAGDDCECFAHPLAVARALNGTTP